MSAEEKQEQGTELARRDEGGLADIARLGQWLALAEAKDESEKGRGATAALRLYYARELGLPPTGANDLAMIHGRLHIGAQTYRALARRAGYRVTKEAITPTSCTAALYGPDGSRVAVETYTLDQAKKAGLVKDRSAWVTHPERMLWARASSNVIRDYAPEVGLGIGIVEEAGDWIEGEAVELPEERAEPEAEPGGQEPIAGTEGHRDLA